MNLEKKLFDRIKNGDDVSLERALLILSGLQTEEEVDGYVEKLNEIQKRFEKYKKEVCRNKELSQTETARLLFEYLWSVKPERYGSNSEGHDSNFLLAGSIDAQLSEDENQKVGNCVDLTSLYSVTGLRENLNLSVLHSSTHVRNRLRDGDKIIDIENSTPFGFDYKKLERGLLIIPGLQIFDCKNQDVEFPVDSLITITWNKRGVRKERLGDLKGAVDDYSKAIEINPEYSVAYNNRGIAKERLGDLKGAVDDYSKAIEINPEFSEAHYNRGVAKGKLGDLEEEAEDYTKVLEINPEYVEAYYNRGIAKFYLGDLEGAIKDYSKAIGINSTFSEAYNNRGIVREKLGDLDGAKRDFKMYKKLTSPIP